LKYVLDAYNHELLRATDTGEEEIWHPNTLSWIAYSAPEHSEALLENRPNHHKIPENVARLDFPNAFGRPGIDYEQVVKYDLWYMVQVPLTTKETATLLTYLTADKTFGQYAQEQKVPLDKQGEAHKIWTLAMLQKLENPDIGFDAPSH